jgi:predicted lipid-binding transport protein (Tim44 family)
MQRGVLGLFVGLPIAGALLGLLMGQLAIGGRNGLYVVPATALVGLLLAWALWASRPRSDAERGSPVAMQEEAEVVRSQAKAQSDVKERQQARERQRGGSVKVTKSGPPDNTGRMGR